MDQLAYSSWKTGTIDFMIMDKNTDIPTHVFELDWNNTYTVSDKRPDNLVKFITDTALKAHPYILTRNQARTATMQGVDMTLAPLALYAYWIDLDGGAA